MAKHGKKRDHAKEPGVEALTKTLNTLISRAHEGAKQGSTNIAECSDLLANLDISPGNPASDAAIKAVYTWVSLEDQDDIVEAIRADAEEDMVALLAGMALNGGGSDEDEEEDDNDDQGTGRGVGPPPAYSGLSSHFGVLEKAAADSGNGDAVFHLQRAKMAMIAAHASKPTRQADTCGNLYERVYGRV